jgi:hypothetical protein
VFGSPRYYAFVFTADGSDLAELLVRNGLARIYGTRTPLPDGRDSRTYLATKGVRQQLFKGNEYWFWLGTEVDHAKVSVHIYNSDGNLAEQPDSWAKAHFAAAHIIPKTTGSYFIIVSVEESPAARTHWALGYGFR